MMPEMPLPAMLAKCETADERAILLECIGRGCRLKATRPYTGKPQSMNAGRVDYVWRMLAFSMCDSRPHCCMPVTADFSFPNSREFSHDERRAECKRLDAFVKRIESAIPIQSQRNVIRWGKAMGMI